MLLNFSSGDYQSEGRNQYAVVCFLPQPLEKIVAPLRERFDPDYNLIAAHVTLVFPFETDRTLDELTVMLREFVGSLGPLTLHLDTVGDFYPQNPIIYWRVKDDGILDGLYKQLYTRLDIPLPFKRLLPHVTVAREISNYRVVFVKDQVATYLPEESFEVKAIDLVSPVAGHHWVSVRTFPLPTV